MRRARGRHDPRVRVRPDACTSSAGPARSGSARPPSTCAASSFPTGGWAIYEGGPAEVSASVKAYFVLKLVGDDPGRAAHGARARSDPRSSAASTPATPSRGFISRSSASARGTTARAVPPEIVLLPGLVRSSTSTRCRPGRAASSCRCRSSGRPSPPARCPSRAAISGAPRAVAPEAHVAADPPRALLARRSSHRSTARSSGSRPRGSTPLRKKALAACEALDPRAPRRSPTASARSSRRSSTRSSPSAASATRSTTRASSRRSGSSRSSRSRTTRRCASSPASRRSGTRRSSSRRSSDSGVPADDPGAAQGRRGGCSTRRSSRSATGRSACPAAEPGGWYFEYANEFYPDTDDTAEVLTALARVRFPGGADDRRARARSHAARRWLLAMQNRDGGWGAFDKRLRQRGPDLHPVRRPQRDDRPELRGHHRPRARGLSTPRRPAGHPAVRARRRLPATTKQDRDGTWYGRWGCNYIYGTWLALRGLLHAGEDLRQPRYQRAARLAARAARTPTAAGASCRTPTTIPTTKGIGPSHAVADRLGADGASSRRATATPSPCAAASTTCSRNQQLRRLLEGRALDRHRLPEGLLPPLPPLRDVLPAAGRWRSTRGEAREPGPTSRTEAGEHRRAPGDRSRSELTHAIPAPHHDRHDPAPGQATRSAATSATRSC